MGKGKARQGEEGRVGWSKRALRGYTKREVRGGAKEVD